MAENAFQTIVTRPGAGLSASVAVVAAARLEFSFDQAEASLGRDGQDLVLSFDDGAKITLTGFYDNFGEGKEPPTLVVEGRALPGEAFLAALNDPDLMPAAGPAAAAPLGGGSYGDVSLSGVDGLDGLDKLAFDGWTQSAPAADAAAAPAGVDGLDALEFAALTPAAPGATPPAAAPGGESAAPDAPPPPRCSAAGTCARRGHGPLRHARVSGRQK